MAQLQGLAAAQLSRSLEQVRGEVAQQHEATVAETLRGHEAQLAELRAHHHAALGALRAEYEGKLSQLEQQLTEQRLTQQVRMQKDLDQLSQLGHSEREGLSKQVATLEGQLTALRERYAGTESALASLRVRYDEAVSELPQLRAELRTHSERAAALIEENQAFQDRVQRAYQRIVADEGQMTRVRRALGIALAVLDEGKPAAVGSDINGRGPEPEPAA